MARKPAFGLVDLLLLLLVLAAAAGTRVGYLMVVADGGATSGPLVVQDPSPELGVLVHNISEQGWFGSVAPLAGGEERTAHTSPGYPWLLGLLSRYLKAEDLEPIVRWIQCGLGTLTAGIYFLFARRAFNSRLVGFLAGLLTAVYPFWVINTAGINDGTVTSFVLALVLYFGSVAGRSGAALPSLLYGLAVAGLALLRAALLPFSFVAILWLLWRSRKVERGWLCSLLAFLGFINGLAPWMIRNYQSFREPVPIVTSTYLHLWEGNNPSATGGGLTQQQLIQALAETRGVSESVLRAELAGVPQPERYRRLARNVFAEIQRHPVETGYRRLSAACYFFFSEGLTRKPEVAIVKKVGDEEPPGWLVQACPGVLLASLALMLGLALIAWRWTYPWRSTTMLLSLAVVWIPLPYVLGHASWLHGPRLPLDGVLLTYAAFVLACLWPAMRKALREGPRTEAEPQT